MQDDLVFQAQCLDSADSEAGLTLTGWWRHITMQWVENNGRLSNILAPFGSLVFPRWLRALISSSSVCVIFMSLGYFSRKSVSSGSLSADAAAMASIWMVSLLCWPWRDRIMLWDYSLNYASAMAVIMLFLFFLMISRAKEAPRMMQCVAIPVSLAAGWMHDGISVPLAGALCIAVLFRRLRVPHGWRMLLAAFFVGILISLSAPGEWSRAGGEIGGASLTANIIMLVKSAPLVPVLVIVIAFAAMQPRLKRKLRGLVKSDLFVISVSFVVFSSSMNLMLNITPRYNWAAGIMAALALWKIGRTCFPATRFRCVMAMAWICLLCTIVPMAAVIHEQHSLWEENSEIEADIAASPQGTIFRDIIMPGDLSPLALKQTTAGIWGNQFQMACRNSHGMTGDRMAAVVPAALKDFSFESAQPLEGSAGIYLWHGFMVSADTIAPFPASQGFPSGRQRSAVRTLRLTNASGEEFLWQTGIFKFNLATGGQPTAVYWGRLPETCLSRPCVKAEL